MLRTTTIASAFVLATGAAQAAVFDFEEFANGEAVNSVSAGGVTATVTVDSNGAFDQAVAFDTSLSNTADPDLEAPFTGSGSANPGNVLIITEDGGPDDERFGGAIQFAFDRPVNLLSFEAFDGGIFDVFSGRGDRLLLAETIIQSDNQSSFVTVPGFERVSFVTFTLADSGEGASGAIDNISFEVAPIPVPAAMPLMLAGLGGLAFVARRRRG